jgi:stearoyl-CoA desaturase (delta-9 desaturase)
MYVAQLHTVWFVNSAAHIFGDRPYNNKIQPRENWWVAITGMGEGFHNYHHTFPWDYTIAENGLSYWNPAKWFIDAMFRLGLCSNLKRPSRELVEKTMSKVRQTPLEEHQFYVSNHPYCQPHGYTDGA